MQVILAGASLYTGPTPGTFAGKMPGSCGLMQAALGTWSPYHACGRGRDKVQMSKADLRVKCRLEMQSEHKALRRALGKLLLSLHGV